MPTQLACEPVVRLFSSRFHKETDMKLRVAKKILDKESSGAISYKMHTFRRASNRVNWETYCVYARRLMDRYKIKGY